MLNSYHNNNIIGEYDVLVSDRVGRTNQKEQYAVYFRKAKVQILVRPDLSHSKHVFKYPFFNAIYIC